MAVSAKPRAVRGANIAWAKVQAVMSEVHENNRVEMVQLIVSRLIGQIPVWIKAAAEIEAAKSSRRRRPSFRNDAAPDGQAVSRRKMRRRPHADRKSDEGKSGAE